MRIYNSNTFAVIGLVYSWIESKSSVIRHWGKSFDEPLTSVGRRRSVAYNNGSAYLDAGADRCCRFRVHAILCNSAAWDSTTAQIFCARLNVNIVARAAIFNIAHSPFSVLFLSIYIIKAGCAFSKSRTKTRARIARRRPCVYVYCASHFNFISAHSISF